MDKKKPNLAMPDTDNTFKVMRSTRDAPPSHYIMKIDSFSLLASVLEKSGEGKYESNEFEAGGHKWRLLLHPNGNIKRDVKGYISLYLAMTNAESHSLGSGDVNVVFKFFLLDQVKEKYTTFEDGRVKTFSVLKNERGISRLLSLGSFNDPANGYLIDDCCIFGAEVFVVKSEGKAGERITVMNEPAGNSFSWTIQKFMDLKDDELYSKEFDVAKLKWKLSFYPHGESRVRGKHASLFLNIHDHTALRPGWKACVTFKLIMRDQLCDHHHESTVTGHWFSETCTSWGYSKFISVEDLKDEKKGFILNNTVIVEAKITSISVVNPFN